MNADPTAARPSLDRRTVWAIALTNARAADGNPWAAFRAVGEAAAVIGCDPGAVAIPYLLRTDRGTPFLVLASAAHRPDGRALRLLTGAGAVECIGADEAARPDLAAPPEGLRIWVDRELARRPVVFFLLGAASALSTNMVELLHALRAEPAEVAAIPLWRRTAVVVIDGRDDAPSELLLDLLDSLSSAGVLAIPVPISPGDVEAAPRVAELVGRWGRERTSVLVLGDLAPATASIEAALLELPARFVVVPDPMAQDRGDVAPKRRAAEGRGAPPVERTADRLAAWAVGGPAPDRRNLP